MEDSVVCVLLKTVGNLVIDEAKFLGKVKSQVEQLKLELELMQDLFKKAEAKNDKQEFRKWLSKFKEVAYDVEDVLESYAFKIGSRQHGGSGITRPASRFISCLGSLPQTHKLGSQISTLIGKITSLKVSLREYAEINNTVSDRHEVGSTKRNLRTSYAHVVENDFVGLGSNVEELIKHLIEERYKTVSIVGMGGLGKTTLAQKIYNHKKVQEHFKAYAWVCISKDAWGKSKILKRILLQIGGTGERKEIEQMEEDELVEELHKALGNAGKCLVVLDDVWGIDAWKSIEPAFHNTNTNFLLTTREENVAVGINPRGFLHKPRHLTDEESWELLQKKVIGGAENSRSTTSAESSSRTPERELAMQNLEKPQGEDYSYQKFTDFIGSKDVRTLGMNMIKHCGGLPLAVIVLGGILARTEQSLDEWKVVDKNIKHYLSKNKDKDKGGASLDEILSLSYDNLPYRLKSCFLYMAAYPEDEAIDTETLYNLWMAEGLVSMEDKIGDEEMLICVAERYLGELVERSMVQVTSRIFSSVLKFDSCRLHDIMRELSLKKATEENFLHVIDESTSGPSSSSSSTCKMRRVRISVNCACNQLWPPPGRMVKNTRSLQLCFPRIKINLNDLQLLRSLVIEGLPSTGYNLTKSVRNLSHLRYLCGAPLIIGISLTSLSKLEHLQTLDLRGIYRWTTTSTVLHKQTKLKDLHLPFGEVECVHALLRKKKLRVDSLRELERLSNFDPNYCEVKDLSKLTKLREVEIRLRHKGVDCIVDVINILNNLKFLDHLYLQIKGYFSEFIACNIQKSLDGDSSSTFVRALKRLRLEGIQIDNDFVEALEKLPNLRQLKLECCRGISELICHSNGFPQLKFIDLYLLSEMYLWRVDEGGMPNLSHLEIIGCEKLKMFPEGLNIKSLKEIQFKSMPEEFSDYVESLSGQKGANFKVSKSRY